MTSQDFGHYINFACNALSGHLPGADRYYQIYRDNIHRALYEIHRRHPVKPETLYRGVLLDPDNVKHWGGVLPPESCRQFISFSSDRKIAEVFADREHDMAFMIRRNYPECQGYLIEHTPDPDEILFHHSWAKPLQIERFVGREILVVEKQKEVMLAQRLRTFKLIPVAPGVARAHGYEMGIP